MADKNETELDQEALDKLMEGASPGIQPWVEEELSSVREERLDSAPTPILFYLANGLASPHDVNPWYDEIKAHTGANYSTSETHKGYIVKNHPELQQPIEEFASIIQGGYLDNLEGEERTAKLQELEDQMMKKYNLPERIDIFSKAQPQATQVQEATKASDNVKYGKKELEGFLKAYDIYLKAPDQVQNKDLLKELDPNYESVHGDLFVDSVEKGTADITAFADGSLDIDSDAIDAMEKYINTFGKDYIKGSYEYTPAAQKALARIKDLRQQAQEKAKKQEAQKAKSEKSNAAKIKELMKKKPQDRTLQDYLFLKEAIEQNPRRTLEQKAKDIESLTSQARLRMKDPKNVKDEELVVVPVFIDAFGYDKDRAINKDARAFRDAMAKRSAQKNPTQKSNVIKNDEPVVEVSKTNTSGTSKKDQKKKKGFGLWWSKTKNWVKRNAAPLIVGLAAGTAILGSFLKKSIPDKDKKDNKIEVVTPIYDGGQLPEVVITPEKTDINMLKQYGKRIAHQENLSTEEAVKRTMEDLEALKNLPTEIQAKLAGHSNEEKLARLGVVRGDQAKLHTSIDKLLKGEKINPLDLKNISERTFKVTDDFGANKDNSLKNGKQSKDMSAYQFLKALGEKGNNSK